MSFFANYPPALNDVQRYVNLAAFPSAVTAGNGALAIALDTGILYESNGTIWQVLATPGASGTVTSVAMTVPGFLSISGSPITTAGTLAVGLSGTALPVTSGGTGVLALGSLTESTSSVLTITGGTGALITSASIQVKQSSGSQSGYLSSTDWTTFNSKQGSGSYITALTGDVTASGPGSAAATLAATTNATLVTLSGLTTAGSLATVGTIGTGVWAGTAVAIAHGGTGQTSASAAFNALSPVTTTGDMIYSASGATNSRLAIGSTGNVLTVSGGVPSWAAPATSGTVTSVAASVPSIFSISGSPITSSGTLTMTYSGTALPVANGGTALTTGTSGGILGYTASGTLASSAALTVSQLVIGGGAGATPTTLAAGSTNQILQIASGIPTWATFSNTTNQNFATTGSTTAYFFVISSASVTAGATYTNNSKTFTAINGLSSGLYLICTGTGAPTSSGTLTYSSGGGGNTGNLTFSSVQTMGTYTTPSNVLELQLEMVGAGAGGWGGGSSQGTSPTNGGYSVFGNATTMLVCPPGSISAAFNSSQGGAGGTSPVLIGANFNGPVSSLWAGTRGGGGTYNASAIATYLPGGQGGGSILFAGGGATGAPVGNAANDGTPNSGGGGGGGVSGATTGGDNGGCAGGGGSSVRGFITSPGATFYTCTGVGGTAGGAGGSSGGAGGNGAYGFVNVWEKYQ